MGGETLGYTFVKARLRKEAAGTEGERKSRVGEEVKDPRPDSKRDGWSFFGKYLKINPFANAYT